jgi:hypothetical protein
MQNSEESVNAIYRPLKKDDREIRLVLLEPATESSMPIICRLEVVKLRDDPIYEALSWAWGDPDDNNEVLLEGRRWLVRTNLVTALRYLRYEDRTRVMWIDALSINQNGGADALREREHQIQLMKYVYSMACHVVVWMQVADDGMAGFIQKFLAGPRSLWTAFEEGEDGFRQTIYYSAMIRRLPWWRRLWVLQEVSLASDTFLQLGSAWINFDRVLSELAMVQYFLRRFFERQDDEIWRVTALAFTPIYAPSPHTFYDLRKRSRSQAAQYRSDIKHGGEAPENNAFSEVSKAKAFQEFAKCIVRFRYHATSDPLDKLYALLGLVPDLVGRELNPRYDEDVVCMYRRTATHIIRSSNSLYILSQAQLPMFVEAPYAAMLPSWVADWNAKPSLNHGWLCAPFRESREELFDASSGASFEVLTRDSDRTLGLQGVMIDIISSTRGREVPRPKNFQQWWHKTQGWRELAGVYEFHPASQTRKRNSPDVLQEHIQLPSIASEKTANGDKDYYIDGSKLNRAYWRTLLYNTAPGGDELDLEGCTLSRVYEPSDPQLATTDRQHLAYCSEDFLEICLNLSESSDSSETLDLQKLFTHLERVTDCGNFFVTNDGFMGTGTQNLRPGDQVWVLAGGSHPFILREDDSSQGHYILVGEAYVEGVMMSGDINKPYASRRVRKQQKMGHEIPDVDDDTGIWEELWLR